MIDTPKIVQTDSQEAAVIHLEIPREQMMQDFGPAIQEIFGALTAQGITPAGPVYAHHFRMQPGIFDFEIGVPVTASVQPVGRVKPGNVPAARVARTVYHGPYEGLPDAWGEFMSWIESNGHSTADNLWEVYAAGPESGPDSSNWRTELNRPLAG